ncbi:hypothetical protein Syun_025401 [Stephania yunnanensis]|uniref:Uncharacterized protein n=1 Tax=Stephania yunnanensis TaxID=152371 RepID=A0AAP0HVR9_9MAGN
MRFGAKRPKVWWSVDDTAEESGGGLIVFATARKGDRSTKLSPPPLLKEGRGWYLDHPTPHSRTHPRASRGAQSRQWGAHRQGPRRGIAPLPGRHTLEAKQGPDLGQSRVDQLLDSWSRAESILRESIRASWPLYMSSKGEYSTAHKTERTCAPWRTQRQVPHFDNNALGPQNKP